MLNFPAWSDLGKVSQVTRASWDNESGRREKLRYYYDGGVFQEKVAPEAGLDDEDLPLKYPVGINIVRMLCQAQTDSMFGEWDNEIVRFDPRSDMQTGSDEIRASELMAAILANSNAGSMLWELELDRQIYGAGVLQIKTDLTNPARLKWLRLPMDGFYPIFDPDNPDELLECWAVTAMTGEQARAKYHYSGLQDTVYRVEHWTRSIYENHLDGIKMGAYSGVNPWGIIPFVFIPRLRSDSWWGESLAEELITIQDELNMRMGDLGEAIMYNSHPTRYGFNLPRSFNAKNFPLGSNVLWDLGRVIGASPRPEVGILEARNPIPQGTFDYIKWLYDWSRTSSFAPPIAFGEDNGGGQRSGITLELRMWPLIKAVRRSRGYFTAGLSKAAVISAVILKQKELAPARAVAAILAGSVVPTFHSIMPRDQAALVDEVTKRLSTDPKTLSLETAVKMLGQGVTEVERIHKDMQAAFERRIEEADQQAEITAKHAPRPAVPKPEPKARDAA